MYICEDGHVMSNPQRCTKIIGYSGRCPYGCELRSPDTPIVSCQHGTYKVTRDECGKAAKTQPLVDPDSDEIAYEACPYCGEENPSHFPLDCEFR